MPCRSFDCGIVAAPSPSSRSSSLTALPASLADALTALSSRRLRGRRSARHLIAAISSRPALRLASARCLLGSSVLLIHHLIRHLSSASRTICLLAAMRPVLRLALRPAFRLAPRPVLPWVMSSPSCPIALPCRSACGHRSPRPACRLGWERDGTDLPLSPLPARPAAVACPWMAWGCVCFDCGGLLAYSVGGSICVCIMMA